MGKSKKGIKLSSLSVSYHKLSRTEKSKKLDELCDDLHGYNCKYLLQVFNCLTGTMHIKPGAKIKYDPKLLLEPLTKIWLASDQMCSKRLKAVIVNWLPYYEEEYGALGRNKKIITKIKPSHN